MKLRFLPVTLFVSLMLLPGLFLPTSGVNAEILDRVTPELRIRLGTNAAGAVDTVIYNAGIPGVLGGFAGVTGDPDTESTNAISGGSGVFEVRIVTDLNARDGLARVRASFFYDSSQPMACITAASCGATTIGFRKIRWRARDNDTLNSTLEYNGAANQLIQTQTDTNPNRGATDTRHRNHYQYIFDNTDLLPAGTYQGTINAFAEGEF